MKPLILKLVLVLIAFVAFDLGPVKASDSLHDYHFSKVPEIDIDPIKNPSLRETSQQINYIADPFIPIVILVHNLYDERDFSFYLPVYTLHRQKNFFLVI